MTISLENITKAYEGKNVLSDFSFQIENEQIVVLYGASGAGKTTVLRILLGLEKPDQGKVVLMGDYKYDYLNAGVVFQENRLCEEFTAVENVAMVDKKTTKGLAEKELTKLLPADRIHIPVANLSGGEKRRVAIVRAMVHPADLFVLDEPFTGLDADARNNVINYIMEMKGSNPLIITAHEKDALSFGRKILVQ